MQNTKRIIYIFCVWFIICTPRFSGLYSQNLVVANSANYRDAKSMFINPAVLAFQPSRLMAGMQIYHVGFIPEDAYGFRNNFFGIASPYLFNQNMVVGLTGQVFGLPIYQQSQFSLSLSHRPFRSIAVGIKYNIFTHSYDKSQFDQIDQYDPVFTKGNSKTSHSFGFGLLFFPKSNLNFAISWDHINRPDVSLAKDGINQPYHFDFGLRYSYKFLSTEFNVNIAEQSSYSCMIESYFPGKGIIRFGYGTKNAKIEGQLKLLRGFSLIYGYDYPLFDFNEISSGSHQICFLYDFAYNRFHTKNEFGKIANEALISEDLFVSMSDDHLRIMKKKIRRSHGSDISDNQLELLIEPELGRIDSSLTDNSFFYPDYKYGVQSTKENVNPKLADPYKQYLKKISHANSNVNRVQVLSHFEDDKKKQVVSKYLNATSGADVQTRAILSDSVSFLKKQNINYRDEIDLLFPEKVFFKIGGDKLNYIRSWVLEIYDYEGNIIQSFQGSDEQFHEIEWDWRDVNGLLLQPDEYFYIFRWKDVHGNLLTTRRKSFRVEKVVRHLKVEVLANPKNDEVLEEADFRIKLHN